MLHVWYVHLPSFGWCLGLTLIYKDSIHAAYGIWDSYGLFPCFIVWNKLKTGAPIICDQILSAPLISMSPVSSINLWNRLVVGQVPIFDVLALEYPDSKSKSQRLNPQLAWITLRSFWLNPIFCSLKSEFLVELLFTDIYSIGSYRNPFKSQASLAWRMNSSNFCAWRKSNRVTRNQAETNINIHQKAEMRFSKTNINKHELICCNNIFFNELQWRLQHPVQWPVSWPSKKEPGFPNEQLTLHVYTNILYIHIDR